LDTIFHRLDVTHWLLEVLVFCVLLALYDLFSAPYTVYAYYFLIEFADEGILNSILLSRGSIEYVFSVTFLTFFSNTGILEKYVDNPVCPSITYCFILDVYDILLETFL
jgi:energy-coupling factor transporter transmembrane protein EcfT